ncbi:MAG: glycosyltransferase family 2 protein [Candidatus Omnitrophica bacterium]|nr:glycosyltransferase family 2 protein [Candidatus Omnitrophota bacterium]
MKLSILMSVYNEERWLPLIIPKVLAQKVEGINEVELIIVDDCSKDSTASIIKSFVERYPVNIRNFTNEVNQGKGSSIKTAISKASGDICVIQDADLEYDPSEYPKILEPIIQGRADCVFGSRFMGSEAKRVLFFWHSVGNKFLTLLSNMFTNLNLTDMETCYKAFRTDLLKSIPLTCRRFGFEPEITSKVAKRRARIYEVGISYNGRTYAEGKKINWLDGVKAIFCIIWFGLTVKTQNDRKI